MQSWTFTVTIWREWLFVGGANCSPMHPWLVVGGANCSGSIIDVFWRKCYYTQYMMKKFCNHDFMLHASRWIYWD